MSDPPYKFIHSSLNLSTLVVKISEMFLFVFSSLFAQEKKYSWNEKPYFHEIISNYFQTHIHHVKHWVLSLSRLIQQTTIDNIFSYLSRKTAFDILYKLSPLHETTKPIFLENTEKNIACWFFLHSIQTASDTQLTSASKLFDVFLIILDAKQVTLNYQRLLFPLRLSTKELS